MNSPLYVVSHVKEQGDYTTCKKSARSSTTGLKNKEAKISTKEYLREINSLVAVQVM